MYSGLFPDPATLPWYPLNKQLVLPFEEERFLGPALPPPPFSPVKVIDHSKK
jgi:hypothetical protein